MKVKKKAKKREERWEENRDKGKERVGEEEKKKRLDKTVCGGGHGIF